MRRQTTTLYAVYWPAHGVLKVGRAQQDRRWRELTATGGKVVLIIGAWELVRPLLNHGLTLALRALWAWELRREMRGV